MLKYENVCKEKELLMATQNLPHIKSKRGRKQFDKDENKIQEQERTVARLKMELKKKERPFVGQFSY